MHWKRSLTSPAEQKPINASDGPPDYPHFAPIATEVFDHLKDLPEKYEVPGGTVLIQQATTPGSVQLLCRGLVRLGYLSRDGAECTLGLRTSGWYAGAVPILMNIPSIYSAVCLGPCTIASIPAQEFSLKLMQNAKMLRHFVSTLCSELMSQTGSQAHLMSSSAEDRLACFMRERNSSSLRWKTADPLPVLKQMELAQLLAVTPETLSRILHKRSNSSPGPVAVKQCRAG